MDSDKRLADLQLLIDEFKRSGLRELQVQHGDFEIYLSQDADAPGLGGTGGAPAVQVQRGAPGDEVSAGQIIALIDVFGRKTEVTSAGAGRVVAINFAANDQVEFGEVLAEIAAA